MYIIPVWEKLNKPIQLGKCKPHYDIMQILRYEILEFQTPDRQNS